MDPLYIFLHQAKTGGTTFVGHLYKNMKFDEDFIDLGPHGLRYRKENVRPELAQRTQDDLNKIKVIVGHLVYWEVQELFPNRDIRMFTFFRKPLPRVISHYTFDTSIEDETFSSWYSRWFPNQTYVFLCDHLRAHTLDEVLTKLETFWHIGFTEDLDTSLKHIYPTLGLNLDYINRRVAGEPENTTKELGYDVRRVIKPPYQPTRDEIEKIRNDHKIDFWLYEHLKSNVHDGNYKKPENLTIDETIYS